MIKPLKWLINFRRLLHPAKAGVSMREPIAEFCNPRAIFANFCGALLRFDGLETFDCRRIGRRA
jgi:hypothetical protein